MDYNLKVQEVTKTHRTAAGYVRASTDEQYLGPEVQHARIEAWCVAYGHELTEVYTDLGVSGGTPLARRPQGAVVHDLIHGKRLTVDALIITRLDRLTRDPGDGYDIVERLTPKRRRKKQLLNLVALDEHIDLSTAFGRFAASLRFQIAGFEREIVGERTSDALQHKARNGKAYGPTPFGWDRDGNVLAPNPDEQATLRLIAGQREAGVSYSGIAKQLNEAGVPSKRGRPWQAMTVYQIVNDPKKDIGAAS